MGRTWPVAIAAQVLRVVQPSPVVSEHHVCRTRKCRDDIGEGPIGEHRSGTGRPIRPKGCPDHRVVARVRPQCDHQARAGVGDRHERAAHSACECSGSGERAREAVGERGDVLRRQYAWRRLPLQPREQVLCVDPGHFGAQAACAALQRRARDPVAPTVILAGIATGHAAMHRLQDLDGRPEAVRVRPHLSRPRAVRHRP